MGHVDLDLSDVNPNGFDPIPRDTYVGQLITMEDKASKNDPANKMFKCVWQIVEGEYAKRQIFDNLNYDNKSPDAQRIGRQRLRQILDALDLPPAMPDTDQLVYRPMLIDVDIEAGNGVYGPQNRILRIRALAAANGPAQPEPLPNAGEQTRPWR